ncbi:methyl-accepting chemotaxis protein [Tenuifilum thalassicum]|uniref:HAMP domain-containing protein n=1 Tax=Tenuifilum thalassicum TaxID=2590900 RepID=A0A7D4AWZ7_9BACT|nr:methyl-accepting chemotaxis protein [Tenuifilum thalassicum]QKG79814.1 HAMP domain-containing protein [Tenuifilum thalassicum]
MSLDNLPIGKRLALGFSLIIFLIVLILLAVFLSNRDVRLENSKQVMLNNLLASNAEVNINIQDFIRTQEEIYLDSAKTSLNRFDTELKKLKPTVTKKNIGIIERIEDNIKVIDGSIKLLEKSNKMLKETSKKLEEESDKALTIAAKIMGGEVSQGVLQFLNIRILEKNFLLTNDEKLFEIWSREIDDNINLAAKLRLNEIVNALKSYKESFITHKEARKEIYEAKRTALNSINQSQSYLQHGVKLSSQLLYQASRRGMISVLLTTLVIMLVCVYIAYRVTLSISKPVNNGVELALNLSKGKLLSENKVNLERKDEFGKLSRALADMSEKLKEVITTINLSANNIASTSEQLSTTSQQVSQGAAQQASSAEEISASMEQMVANIQNNTDNAKQAESIANKSVEGIRKGYDSTSFALNSMKKIAEKVSIIGDIAFQTNILALNAAVEAARAGEQGKGFAVVAAEVRKLAERSRLAAEEIDIITHEGVKIADEAGKLLADIVPDIEKTARLVQEIAAASMEQNAGADQVNSAIQELNQVTQQNAAVSEEMASSAEELNSQAQQLIEIISFFDFGEKRLYSGNKLANETKHVNVSEKKKIDEIPKSNLKKEENKKKANNGIEVNLKPQTDDSEYESF